MKKISFRKKDCYTFCQENNIDYFSFPDRKKLGKEILNTDKVYQYTYRGNEILEVIEFPEHSDSYLYEIMYRLIEKNFSGEKVFVSEIFFEDLGINLYVIAIYPRCNDGSCRIAVNIRLKEFPDEIERIILHELVHVWNYLNNSKTGHRGEFVKKLQEVNAPRWGSLGKLKTEKVSKKPVEKVRISLEDLL